MYKTNQKVRVLIIEDEYLYRKSLIIALQDIPEIEIAGEAENGEKGVCLSRKLKPNVVLMDLGLPVLNGISATRQIKGDNPDTKVIILTSHSNENEAMRSLAAGADAYARKDVKIDYLVMIIETVNKGAVWLDPLIGQKVLSESVANYSGKK